jgi:hypothetical protein
MTDKNHRLEKFLETLDVENSAKFEGTLVLGELVGQISTGGYLNPTQEFHGKAGIKKTERGYEFIPDDSDSICVFTTKSLRFQKESAPYYATKLRRFLRNTPHLSLDATDNLNQKYHFAVLYLDKQ